VVDQGPDIAADERLGPEAEQDKLGVVGRYRLIAKLGHGGMADVFLAVANGPASFNKLVVVKRLRSAIAENEDHVRMLLDEAKLSGRLNHPNIVHTYEVGGEDGSYFIVMEYLEGQPLNRISKAVTRKQPGSEGFTRGTWLRIVAEMLSGLHHAHELCDYDGTRLGIVHRDVSPQNVFVTYDGAVKVVDFGIAKAALNSTQTQTGVFKGKAAYTSPEQARGIRELDRRADIFSAGIVLWELIARQRLFGGDYISALHRLVNEGAPRLSTVVPDIPPALDAIVTKALMREPEERFATAQEMRWTLESYLRSSGEDVRVDDLGTKMLGMYDERRTKMRQQIKAQLDRIAEHDSAMADAEVSPANGLPCPESRQGTNPTLPTLENSSRQGSVVRSKSDDEASSLRPTARPALSGTRGYLVGGLGLVAMIGAAVFSVLLPRKEAPSGPVATTQEAAPAVGVVSITSDPPEATVSWNGRILGKTPLKVDLPVGTQSVVVSRATFLDATLVVTVSPTITADRSVSLQSRENAPAPVAKAVAGRSAELSTTTATRRTSRGTGARSAPPAATATPTPAPVSVDPVPATAAAPRSPPVKAGIQIVSDEPNPTVKVNIIE
jgi:serine/threonine-protein kinase